MKRILFDHNVPARLARYLQTFEIKLADEMGWARIQNGQLLRAAEDGGFEILLTADKTLRYEQNMAGRKIGVVAMSDNHWNIVQHYVPAIIEAVDQVKPGELRQVYCGTFVPKKLQKG